MSAQHVIERLKALDLDAMAAQAYADARSGKKTKRKDGIKVLRALTGLKRAGATVDDLLVSKVPVIPAPFRPYTAAGETFIPGDANELYSDLIQARDIHNETVASLGAAGAVETGKYLRDAVRAAYGYGASPNPKIKARGVSGFLSKVLGSGPKTSFVQQKLISKPQDFVGRAVISPDPELGMDEIGLPKDMAWELYEPHVRRRLIAKGIPASRAITLIKDRSHEALHQLVQEMAERPVLTSRAPAWHRFSVVSAYPKLTEGDNIKISPYVTAGLNADFNGDQQVGKILVLAEKNTISESLLSDLQCECPALMVAAVMEKKIVPVFDLGKHRLFLCDMEDLPRGDKMGENRRGKNGRIDFFRAPDGLRAVSWDEQTCSMVWAPVLGISVHYQRELELVELSNGRQIVTDDDPRAVYGMDTETGEFVRATPTDALVRRLVVPCAKDLTTACAGLGAMSHIRVGERDVLLDFDFGYLVGALVGDGWWDKRSYNADGRRVYISDLSGYAAAHCKQVLTTLFGRHYYSAQEFKAELLEGRYGDTVRHTFGGKRGNLDDFVAFCEQWLGGAGDDSTTGSGNKKLPDLFLLSPEEFRRGLLTGIFDTDGTCSISNAKERPQLLCSVTTTSVRLAADIKFLCLTLGVHASIGFSKTTSRGNTSWICSVSTPDLKARDLLRGLRHPEKRGNFTGTEVAQNNTSLVNDKVVVPRKVFAAVEADLIYPKAQGSTRRASSAESAMAAQRRNMWTQWHKSGKSRVMSRPGAEAVIRHLEAEYLLRVTALGLAKDQIEAMVPGVFTSEAAAILRAGVYATVAPFSADRDKGSAAYKSASAIKTALFRKNAGERCISNLRRFFENRVAYRGALDSPAVAAWLHAVVGQRQITWAAVTAVHKTGIREDGYDLTVPGYDTFMSADGVILSNTMAIHAPALPEAVKDAREKLLPSKMLFAIRDRNETMAVPKHEQVLGLAGSQLRPSGKVHRFNSEQEALEAVRAGTVRLHDTVELPDAP